MSPGQKYNAATRQYPTPARGRHGTRLTDGADGGTPVSRRLAADWASQPPLGPESCRHLCALQGPQTSWDARKWAHTQGACEGGGRGGGGAVPGPGAPLPPDSFHDVRGAKISVRVGAGEGGRNYRSKCIYLCPSHRKQNELLTYR